MKWTDTIELAPSNEFFLKCILQTRRKVIDLNDIRHACIKNKLPFIGQHILDSRNKYKNIIKSHWHILIKIIQLIGTPQI